MSLLGAFSLKNIDEETKLKIIENSFNKYKHLVMFIIKQKVRSKEDAEDILSDSFVSLYESLEQVESIYAIKSYVSKIAHNLVNQYLKDKSEKSFEFNENYINKEEDNEELIFDDSIKEWLNIISPIERKIVVDYVIFDKKFIEISKELKYPIDFIKSSYRRALKELKKFYLLNNNEDDYLTEVNYEKRRIY